MNRIRVVQFAGTFAGDKDAAARIRQEALVPALERNQDVILDFKDVDLATQSFVHAMLAAVVRDRPASLEHIMFENCNESIKSLIQIVVEYAQQDLDLSEPEIRDGSDE